jgi:acetyl esterase/lipase
MRIACAALFPLLLLQDAKVKEVKDLPYFDGAGADAKKHKLNLYLPVAQKAFPLVMFIHGGGWSMGDRSLYPELGRRFAERGIALAAISYRLSPAVKHPEHVKDCARALSWLASNIHKHGGDPKRMFVMGHSAGGHLTALLTLDRKYLDELSVPADAIQGAIPMSGPYTIPALPQGTNGILKIFPDAFGSDKNVCRDASPVTHVKHCKVPLLVLTETTDTLRVRPMMEQLRDAVKREGVNGVEFVDAEERDHNSIVTRMMGKGDDPYRDRVIEFVRSRCKELDGK